MIKIPSFSSFALENRVDSKLALISRELLKFDRFIWMAYEVKFVFMEAQIKIHIAQTIKSARQQKGFTQQDLGELIGRTSESLSNIERAKSIPSVETLVALSTALKLPVSAFFPEFEENSEASPKRLRLEAEASGIIRNLSERMLETAVEQLKALAKISS